MLKKISLVLILTFSVIFNGIAQNNLQQKITVVSKNQSLKYTLDQISSQTDIYFSFNTNEIDANQNITLVARNQSVNEVIKQLCSELSFKYTIVEKQIILKPYTPASPKQQDTQPTTDILPTDNKFTISGYIKDTTNNEVLIGATIVVNDKNIATVTNSYGFYSLTLPKGSYNLKFSFIGYESKTYSVNLNQNVNLSQELKLNIQELNIVTVTNDRTINQSTSELKRYKLNNPAIINRPALAGESDVVKNLQSVAGISIYGEGSVMFNVRGGDKGQNAIFIDEAPVYNPAHLMGFFSAIAPEAINSVTVYKNTFPMQYSSRLSSVIDIRTKDGSTNKTGFGGTFSPYSTTLFIDGPIKKEKSSYTLTFRGSNFNYLFKNSAPNVGLNFNDIHFKYNKKFSRKNRIYLAFYSGKDNLSVSNSALQWKNSTFTFRWNHLFTDKLFSNTTFFVSNYKYFLYYSIPNNLYWTSNNSIFGLKNNFTLYYTTETKINFGFETNIQKYNPGNLNIGNTYWQLVYASNVLENDSYLSLEHKITKNLSINAGLKLTNWNNFGPTQVYTFDDENNPQTLQYFGDEIFNSFLKSEYQVSALWSPNKKNSFTFGIDKNVQYIHFLSNSITPLSSLDVWLPSGLNIKPQISHQLSAGYQLKLAETYFILETYYKKMKNQIDYVNQPNLFLNPLYESQLCYGTTKATGIEFTFEKQKGRLKNRTTYTYSRAIRQTTEVNNNLPYPAIWDKPHNFFSSITYDISERTSMSFTFIYQSGNRFSSPTGFYYYQNYTVPIYETKNNDKLPDYHRLDFSIKKRLNKNPHNRFEHFFTFSIYNLYGRKNIISVNFDKIETENGDYLIPKDYITESELVPTSLSFFGFLPSVSYQFKFR